MMQYLVIKGFQRSITEIYFFVLVPQMPVVCFNRLLNIVFLRRFGLFLLSDSCMKSLALLSNRPTRNRTRYHKHSQSV